MNQVFDGSVSEDGFVCMYEFGSSLVDVTQIVVRTAWDANERMSVAVEPEAIWVPPHGCHPLADKHAVVPIQVGDIVLVSARLEGGMITEAAYVIYAIDNYEGKIHTELVWMDGESVGDKWDTFSYCMDEPLEVLRDKATSENAAPMFVNFDLIKAKIERMVA